MNPAYLEDASGFRGWADALYLPSVEAELPAILRDAFARDIPVTIAGAGTGLTGARVAQGGWVVSLEKFDTIRIHPGRAIAGAGALLHRVQAGAHRTGQFYPPDPTETAASIGGAIATNASGSRSFRYGDTRAHVLALRVAFADGSIRSFRRGEPIDFEVAPVRRPRTTKHSAGFLLYPEMDWIDLFTGSEGTLGVVTEAELKLLPAPGELLAGVVFFTSDHDALAAVDAWRALPALRMIEYFDAACIELLRGRYPDLPAAAHAGLLIEQEISSDAGIDEWERRLRRHRALLEQSWFGAADSDRERFRRFRHAIPETVNDTVRRRGLLKMGSDYAVPLEHNTAMLRFYRERLDAAFPGRYVVFGHIGDAHVHVNILPRSAEEADRAAALMLDLARRAVELGGTVGAEHGLGKRKAHLLAIQYSEDEIAAMRAVKSRLDPKWLLGRGTLLAPP